MWRGENPQQCCPLGPRIQVIVNLKPSFTARKQNFTLLKNSIQWVFIREGKCLKLTKSEVPVISSSYRYISKILEGIIQMDAQTYSSGLEPPYSSLVGLGAAMVWATKRRMTAMSGLNCILSVVLGYRLLTTGLQFIYTSQAKMTKKREGRGVPRVRRSTIS